MAISIQIRADATQFSRTIAGVRVQMSGLSGGIANVTSSAISFGASLAKVGIALGAVGGAIAAAFIKSSSDAAASMESLTVQLEVLTGSATQSKELIKAFREEAQKSPLSVSDYANAGKTIMAFGVSADKTLPILRTLGDVSMGNAERFGSLALAFAQTQAAGRLMGQEVLQFINAGFNPLQEISRKTGRSMIDLKKAMEDGAISSAMVSDAFVSATSKGGLFFGALDKGAATTEGRIAKLKDTVLGLKVAFGTGFNEGLVSALDASGNAISGLESRLASSGKMLGQAIKNAVSGDYEMFVQIGVVIGEALIAGAKSVFNVGVSSVIRDGIGGYISAGGRMTGNDTVVKTGQLVSAGINKVMGPGQSMGDTIKEKFGSEGLTTAVKALERMAVDSSQKEWAEQLRRQTAATEELVRQGKDATKENMQILFSR